MKLQDMSTSDVKTQIAVLEGNTELSRLMIGTWKERKDPAWVDAQLKIQRDIIRAAEAAIGIIGSQRDQADEKIKMLGMTINYNKKELLRLRNRSALLKLVAMREKLAAEMGESVVADVLGGPVAVGDESEVGDV